MSSPQVYLGNGVQTRFEVPGSVSKVVRVNGAVTPPASSDAQSVTLSVAPGVGVPVQIDWVGTTQPLVSGGLPAGGSASAVLTKLSGADGDATWAAASSGAAPVTLTASTNLTPATHGNRTIYADSTTAITLTIQTGGWVDGDYVYVVAKNLVTGKITVGDQTNAAIKPSYIVELVAPGHSIKLRYDATTTKWQAMEMPIFLAASPSGLKMTMAKLVGSTGTLNFTSDYSDTMFSASSIWHQVGNSGVGLAPTDARIFAQSTLLYTPATNGDQAYSRCRVGAEAVYYDNAGKSALYLFTTSRSNTETVFPGATEIGDRNRLVITGGKGFIIGSDAQNSYNGKWSQYDTWGNASFLRSWGNASRQKDVASTGTVTIGMGVTNLILAGSGIVTVALPATPYDGQIASLQVRTAYTSITMSGNGMAVTTGTAVGTTAGSFASFRFDSTDSTWDRMS